MSQVVLDAFSTASADVGLLALAVLGVAAAGAGTALAIKFIKRIKGAA